MRQMARARSKAAQRAHEAPVVWVPNHRCARCGGAGWVTDAVEAGYVAGMYGMPRRDGDGAALCPCVRREAVVPARST